LRSITCGERIDAIQLADIKNGIANERRPMWAKAGGKPEQQTTTARSLQTFTFRQLDYGISLLKVV